MVKIKIKKLHPEATIPHYVHEGDAGMDVYSVEDVLIRAGEKAIISSGIAIELPKGYVALVWDKSGLAAKHGIKTMAGVGDSIYRGEYKIVLLNTSKQDYQVRKGERICQILIQPVVSAEIEETQELSSTERGEGGFGSTGARKS
jgi:dUTP pyrophosphatase